MTTKEYNAWYRSTANGKAKILAGIARYRKSEKGRAYRSKYEQSLKGKLNSYKTNAKARGIQFALTLEQFSGFWGKPCHYCGDAIDTIGLDRVDSSLGYTVDNVVPCCRTCNIAKLDQDKQAFIRHCAKVVRHSGNIAIII